MDDRFSQLPWAELWHTQGEIPWSALETFADAVTAEPALAEEFFRTYAQARELPIDKTCYATGYVPAIFAMAAPKLDETRRRMIGEFLVKKLAEAGQDDDELMMEILAPASGSMGPVIVPTALDAIAAEPDSKGAWFHLWNLTALANETDDAAVRDLTARACVELLERADRGEIKADDGIEAAHTLGLLGRAEHLELVKRVSRRCDTFYGVGDYEEAIDLLRGSAARDESSELWQEPIQNWFEPRWQMMKDWFARREAEAMEELNADPTEPRNLVRRFLKSAWATNLPDDLFEEAGYIIGRLVEYAEMNEGTAPDELDEQTLRGVLLEMFPRKITRERDFFAMVTPVVEAFLGWMGSEDLLENAAALAQAVRGWAPEIVAAAMNPENWGPVKTKAMKAQQAGVDITDEAAINEYLYEQTLKALEDDAPEEADEVGLAPAAPIVEHSPKIGRNDPCPCGSGKKYKKCCGSPTKGQTANA
jgi:hypothetical protein